MAIVFKTVALQPPGRQWQHRIKPVQGLDGGLFVHAKHRRMLRRFDVQSDNIGRLSLKVGVVGGHVAFDPMGLKPGALPDPRHHHVADAQVAGQLAAAPSSASNHPAQVCGSTAESWPPAPGFATPPLVRDGGSTGPPAAQLRNDPSSD